MPLNGRNRLNRRYKRDKIDFDSIRWPAVFAAAAMAVLLIVGGIFGVRALMSLGSAREPLALSLESPAPPASAQASGQPSQGGAVPADSPLGSLANPIDFSADAVKIVSKETSVNMPDIHGHEMVYSAGTGSLLKPLLKTLYLYDFEKGEEKAVATVQIKDGEIFETVVNDDYIAWLDTDQQGSNAIYCLYRDRVEDGPQLIRNCKFAVPKIRLSNDFLVWIEQINPEEERLVIFDLISQEDAMMPGFVESVEEAMATYGVSAPSIYGSEVVWAATDPGQSEQDRILNGERSAVYSCDLNRFVEDDYVPAAFQAGMYVHDPITNGEVWAWIDKNKAPDSNLYIRVGEETVKVAENVITYTLGDEMLVFGKDGNIYVYFYKTGKFGRVTAAKERGILPVVSGRRVVWFDKSSDSQGDQLMAVTVPYQADAEQ